MPAAQDYHREEHGHQRAMRTMRFPIDARVVRVRASAESLPPGRSGAALQALRSRVALVNLSASVCVLPFSNIVVLLQHLGAAVIAALAAYAPARVHACAGLQAVLVVNDVDDASYGVEHTVGGESLHQPVEIPTFVLGARCGCRTHVRALMRAHAHAR